MERRHWLPVVSDSAPRAGATNATLTITNSQTTDNGSYFAVVTNQYGAATGAVAVLNVIPNYGNLVQFDPFPYTPGTLFANQGGWILPDPRRRTELLRRETFPFPD